MWLNKLTRNSRKAIFIGFPTAVIASLSIVGCNSNDTARHSDRVDDLMSKMTIEEKLGQLNLLPGGDLTTGNSVSSDLRTKIGSGQVGAVLNVRGADKIHELQRIAVEESRLGIPLIVGLDVIHGYETVLPIPLAQGCSWDTALVRQGAAMAAEEATAAGINWVYSPMVDVAHDARWGRIAEGFGEDPFLSGEMGAAMTKGYQGEYCRVKKENGEYGIVDERWQSDRQVMACLKHYALYGAVEAGKDYNHVDMSRNRMLNQYMPPYKRCVEAGVGSVMTSFNLVDGVPATSNKWLITDILRDEWGFDGFVVTDYASISEMESHGLGDVNGKSAKEANALAALYAGTDMDMCSEAYIAQIGNWEQADVVAQIDKACRRVLEAKERLGLLDDPYRFCKTEREKTDLYTPEHRETARKMATESLVLLKNEGDLLPLKKSGRIALIGPLGDTRSNIVGCWSTGDKPEKYSTLLEAMREHVGDNAVVTYAQGSNIYDNEKTQTNADFGRHIARVDKSSALAEAVKTAKQADVVVLALGELAEMSGESSSRAEISMPDAERDLMEAIVKVGKPVVLLNFAGRPTDLSWEDGNIQAIMNVWFAGSETGDAICDVIFGNVCPSGKLVTTMPRCVGQLPLYYNHTNGSRPVPDGNTNFRKYQSNYIDVTEGPLYPFGFGLSYSKFAYSDMSAEIRMANSTEWTGDETISVKSGKIDSLRVSVTVSNTGSRDADEVVQLYVGASETNSARPVKELKAFRRIHVKAGQSEKVTFQMSAEDALGWETDTKLYKSECGRGVYQIMVGGNSRDVITQKRVICD